MLLLQQSRCNFDIQWLRCLILIIPYHLIPQCSPAPCHPAPIHAAVTVGTLIGHKLGL